MKPPMKKGGNPMPPKGKPEAVMAEGEAAPKRADRKAAPKKGC